MQDLKELILLLHKSGVQPLKGLNPDAMLVLLQDGILKGKFTNDKSAAEALYDEVPESSKYRKLKSDLRDRLLQSVLEITGTQGEYSDYQRAYYQCHREWAILHVLIGQNASTTAIPLAVKLLKKTLQYDFTMLSLDIAGYLRLQYGLLEGESEKFWSMQKNMEHLQQLYAAETNIESIYALSAFQQNHKKQQEGARSLIVTHTQDDIINIISQYHSYKLQLYSYLTIVLRATAVGDYEAVAQYCDAAIFFFKNRPYEARGPLQIFYYYRLGSNIQLRQYDQGRESAEFCLSMLKEGTFNWFKYNELYLKLLFVTGRYEEAHNIITKVISHSQFEFLSAVVHESWRVYQAYAEWLVSIGKITPSAKWQKFKVAKFLNDTPAIAKEKQGLSISILVLKTLFNLSGKRYSQLLDELESIEQYCYRHLRSKSEKRSFLFVRMLCQIVRAGFNPAEATRRAARYEEELRATPVIFSLEGQNAELIPYEDLWKMAIDII